jgi:ABC-type lipoprotein export system ATPase subunit
VALMLKRFVIENYRSCLRTQIDLHPNLSVLIGPNGSGKTNILQAIMFLNKMAQQNQYRPTADAITVSSRVKAMFQRGRTRTRLNASVNAYTDESNNDVILASRQRWVVERQDEKSAAFEVPLSLAAHFPVSRISQRHFHVFYHVGMGRSARFRKKIPTWADRALSDVAKYCTGITYYGASQFTNPGTCPASFQIEQEGKHRRLTRLRGHARILYNMYSAKKGEPNNRYKQFIDIVGPKGLRLIDDLTFREVQTSSSEYSVLVGGKVEVRRRHKLLVVPQFRIGRQKLSPNQLSEGTFKTLALLFHVITEDSTVLLIEEPEVCVHHGLLSSILELIKSYSRHKQMILSTHSDYVLDHVSPENVYRVAFDKSRGTVVRNIPKTMKSRELLALREYLEQEGNLGEYWREGGLGDRP